MVRGSLPRRLPVLGRIVAVMAAVAATSMLPQGAAMASGSGTDLVSVGDYVWLDVNRDGDQDAEEPPVAQVAVELRDASGNLVDSTETDASGHYVFTDLVAGASYTLSFLAPSGYSFTTTGAASADQDSDGAQVSFVAPLTGSNGSELPDDSSFDAGLVAFNLVLDKELTSTTHAPGGTVKFTLTPANEGPADALAGWTVHDLMPAQLTLISMSGTGYDCDKATAVCTAAAPLAAGAQGEPITVVARIDASVTSGRLHNLAYVAPAGGSGSGEVPELIGLGDTPTRGSSAAESETDNDAEAWVSVGTASVGDYVWFDSNRDGRQNSTDAPLAGVRLTLSTPSGAPVTDAFGNVVGPATTDATGHYLFSGLLPGSYVVTIDPTSPALTGLVPTKAGVGGSASDSSTGSATSQALQYDEADLSLDFGFRSSGPAIQIVKTDAAGNDANTEADAVHSDAKHIELHYTVTNTGGQALSEVSVADQVVQGGTVHDLTCTFPDGSTGTTWSGSLAPGDSFECTATLDTVNGLHLDNASVSASSGPSGSPVTDDDPYYAVINIPTEVSPGSGHVRSEGNGTLPAAGTPVSAWFAAASAAAVVLGLAMLVANRRRS